MENRFGCFSRRRRRARAAGFKAVCAKGKETGIVQEETEISDKISVEQEEKQQEEEQKDEDLEEPIEEIQESLSVENQEKQEELEETCLEEGKVPSGSAIMLTESLESNGFLYTLNGNTVTITGYNGTEANVVIPEEIDGCPVIEIGESAFSSCSRLISIELPQTIEKIDMWAFMHSGLKNIEFPESLKEIGGRAFEDCDSLVNIFLPKSVQKIGASVFSYCDKLESVVIEENSEVVLEAYAFSRCPNLKDVRLSSNISIIERGIFMDCESLCSLQLPTNVKHLGELMISGTKIASIVIPKGVETGSGALSGCETLKEVIFEEGMEVIPSSIANGNYIEKVVIPEGIKEIGKSAFSDCSRLTNIELPQTIEKIDMWAFMNSGLKNIEFPESLKEIGGRAFEDCDNLVNIFLPKSVQKIGASVFEYCDKLESVVMEENSEVVLGAYAFKDCTSLEYVKLSSNISTMERGVFSGCESLRSLQLPANVKHLGELMISGTKITSIVIPKGVEVAESGSYGSGVLSGCETLKEVIFEEGMEKIPQRIASTGLDYLEKVNIERVVIPASVTEIGKDVFSIWSKITIYGYEGSYAETYANENNIPFNTVIIAKDATAEQVLAKFSLGDLIKNVSIKGEKIDGPEIEIGNYSFPLFSVDVALEMKLGEAVQAKVDTETKTIQVLIGFKDFSGSASLSEDGNKTNYWSESYKQVKDLYTGMTGKKVDSTKLWNNFSKLRGKLRKVNGLKMGIDGNASVVGYMEFSYASGEIVLSQGGVIAEIGLGTSFEYKIPPFPIAYLTFGAEVEAGAKISLVRESAYCYNPAADLSLGLSANIGVGVGEKKIKTYVEGGLKGGLKFGFKLPCETFAKAFSAKLTGKVYFESKVLGFDGPSYTNEFDDIILYPKTTKGIEAFAMEDGDGVILDIVKMQPISRDYLYTASIANESRAAQPNVLLNIPNQYPYHEARIACLDDGTKLLLWVGDMGTKSDVNKTSLCYSIYNGSTWSEPKVTSDTGGLNDYPYIVSDGKTVSILWQKTDSAMPDSAGLEEILKSMDLYFMTYQNGTFSKAVKITENSSSYEMFHSLAVCKNQIGAAWIENSANDPFLLEGTNVIKKAVRKNGKWTVSTIAEGLSQIDNCAAVNWNDEPGVLYECEDQIYIVTDSETITLQGKNAQVENNLLYYESGEVLMVYDISSKQSRETGLPAFGTTYTVTILDNNPVISAVSYTGFTSELVAYRYEKERGNWSELIRLSDDAKYIRSYQMTEDREKNLIAVFNLVEVTEDAEKIYGTADIQVVNFMEGHDLKLEHAWYEEEQVVPGRDLPIIFEVKNNSIEKVTAIHAMITDETGSVAAESNLSVELQAGETGRFSVSYPLPDSLHCHKITLTVTAEDETALQDNEIELTIGNADISVEEVVLSGTWENAELVGTVKNIGYQTAEGVRVQVYTINFEEEITVIEEISLGSVEAGTGKNFTVSIPKEYREVDLLAFGNEIYIEALTDTEQTQFSNDLVKYIIRSELDAPFVLNKSELTLKEGESETLLVSYSALEDAAVEWNSSNPSVATVEGGVVKAISNGKAEITASVSGNQVSCIVVVEGKKIIKVEGIYAQNQSITLKKGESTQLQATILPSDATNQKIDWTSDDTQIAEVKDGVVKGIALGETIITARTEDGNKIVQYQISIVQEQDFQEVDPKPESKYAFGDINRNGGINSIDAVLTLNYASGLIELDEEQQKLADVNGDGKINSTDAVLILNKASGNILRFPVEQ